MHFYHSQVIYVFLFFFSERSFRHGPFGLDCYRGLVLVAVLRYLLRRYRNFIVVRERRQAGAASLSNPQLMPGRAAEQRQEALKQLFRTAEPAEDTNSHGGTGEEDQERASDPTPRPVHASAHPDQEVRHAEGFATGVEIL